MKMRISSKQNASLHLMSTSAIKTILQTHSELESEMAVMAALNKFVVHILERAGQGEQPNIIFFK